MTHLMTVSAGDISMVFGESKAVYVVLKNGYVQKFTFRDAELTKKCSDALVKAMGDFSRTGKADVVTISVESN